MSNTDTAAPLVIDAEDDQVTTIESKHALKSVGAWGALIALAPMGGQMLGFTLSPADVAHIQQAGTAAQDAVQHVQALYAEGIMLFGVVQMPIGRFNARQPLHFIPGGAYKIDAETGRRITPVKVLNLTPDIARIWDGKPVLKPDAAPAPAPAAPAPTTQAAAA